MQVWVRRLSIVAVGAVALALLTAGAPATLAYEDPTPHHGNVIKAWHPQYTTMQFDRKYSNEGGPVELPKPIDPPPGAFANTAASTPIATPGAKLQSSVPGALPTGRGAAGLMDPEVQAERRVQQVI